MYCRNGTKTRLPPAGISSSLCVPSWFPLGIRGSLPGRGDHPSEETSWGSVGSGASFLFSSLPETTLRGR